MKTITRLIVACALCAVPAAALAAGPSACEKDPKASGLTERVHGLKDQMERIEWAAADAATQAPLMDLHLKRMQESVRELRRREVGDGCRMEVMHAMLEQMLRHQVAARDAVR